MTTLTVQMPDAAVDFIQQQATAGGFESPGAYLASLVECEQQRLEAALAAGFDSGPSRPMTRGDWNALRQRVHEREAAGPQP
jgi:hypothetical protein